MKYFYVSAALALAVALAACSGDASNANTNATSAASSSAAIATVGGRPVSAKLYEMYLKNGREELGLSEATEEGRRKIEYLREGIVSELIDRAVIAREAERRGLVVTPEKLSEREARAVAQFGGEEKYAEYLASHGLTRDEWREVIRTEIYGELLREELRKDVKVSDEDVRKFYDERKADPAFQLPERVTASHVLINARPNLVSQEIQRARNLAGADLERAVGEEMNARRARAEEVRRRAAGGADFAALARELSEDPATRERGGDLGTFARDSHPRAFDDAAFRLRPGEVSGVVQTDYGFHVIKATGREAARSQTFDEAATEIRRRLATERESANLRQWLKEARRTSDVRIEEPYRFGALKEEFPSN
ncbi:MAG TPA: peptidylprolyl isomerase [Pyrinomonadaceae bacterium]|nr:peptidylprolyl isomerase [Pyrinomonadaceae bacterium]